MTDTDRKGLGGCLVIVGFVGVLWAALSINFYLSVALAGVVIMFVGVGLSG